MRSVFSGECNRALYCTDWIVEFLFRKFGSSSFRLVWAAFYDASSNKVGVWHIFCVSSSTKRDGVMKTAGREDAMKLYTRQFPKNVANPDLI